MKKKDEVAENTTKPIAYDTWQDRDHCQTATMMKRE